MKNYSNLKRAAAVGGIVLGAMSARAGLIFTIENPGVQSTSVSGAITETFDNRATGAFSGTTVVGALSSGGAVVSPDAYGGAYQTRYYAVGVQSGGTSSTLSFSSPQDYFGMLWAAGDAKNQLSFYNGTTLLGSYRVGDIISRLSPSYFGNPNTGADKGEPFVYLNFTTTGSDVITSVQFRNDTTGSGFEMDNFSIYNQTITPPGVAIPDGGSTAAMLGGSLAAAVWARRRTQSKRA